MYSYIQLSQVKVLGVIAKRKHLRIYVKSKMSIVSLLFEIWIFRHGLYVQCRQKKSITEIQTCELLQGKKGDNLSVIRRVSNKNEYIRERLGSPSRIWMWSMLICFFFVVLFCLVSLRAQCYMCFCIIHYWVSLRFSLMFMLVYVGLGNIVLQLPILFACRASQVLCQCLYCKLLHEGHAYSELSIRIRALYVCVHVTSLKY